MQHAFAEQMYHLPPIVGLRIEAGDGVDQLLAGVASDLVRLGVPVQGVIQTRGDAGGECACAEMYLHDLATGRVDVISEKRGSGAQGCQLDWEALTDIAGRLEADLTAETGVLIINRFGRSESEGRGFRRAIEKAIELGVTVIIAFRPEYEGAWEAFHGGLAVTCGSDRGEIVSLCARARA